MCRASLVSLVVLVCRVCHHDLPQSMHTYIVLNLRTLYMTIVGEWMFQVAPPTVPCYTDP